MGEEQRRFARIHGSFRVRCRRAVTLAEPWRDVVTKDLSAGGMSFQSEVPFEPADHVELQISLPNFQEPVVLSGRIVRETLLLSGIADYAVEFVDVTPDQQFAIDEMVRFLSRRPDAP